MESKTSGWLNGFIGVLIFSASLPATRIAVLDFDPVFLTGVRAVIAGIVASTLLLAFGQYQLKLRDIVPLSIIAGGVVIGFPLLTALALREISSAQSIIFIGLLPLCTAIFGVIRGGERPPAAFWAFAAFGSSIVVGYAASQSSQTAWRSDSLMIAAILICGMGYAEGGLLSRRVGGWQVISWALVLSLPFMLSLSLYTMPMSFSGVPARAWIALAYLSLFSMMIGFVFWYRGLALGGIAAVGQLQLLQPFFGLGLVAWLLNESVSLMMFAVTVGVVLCVACARRYAP